jgi:hypothetical protein
MDNRRHLVALAVMAMIPGLSISPREPRSGRRLDRPARRDNADGTTTWCCETAYLFEGEHSDNCQGLPLVVNSAAGVSTAEPIVIRAATEPSDARVMAAAQAKRDRKAQKRSALAAKEDCR